MKSPTILVAALAVATIALLPNSTQAAGAMMLTDTTALITLEFSLTAAEAVHQVPVLASSTVGYFDRVNVVGYQLAGAEIASVSALVLNGSPIQDARYQIQTNTTEHFTVLIIATLSEPLTNSLTASLTKIPYWRDGSRTTTHQNQLDQLTVATVSAQ